LTAEYLAKAMKLFLESNKNVVNKLTAPANYAGKGKQTVKQLVGQGQGVTNIEISDKNIKSFESIARKYGVDFAVKKDASEHPPKWLVFFKGRDTDALTAAFKEYSSKHMSKSAEKPSMLGMLRDLMEKVKNQVLDTTKHKDRGLDI
jgi:hypothetical protein